MKVGAIFFEVRSPNKIQVNSMKSKILCKLNENYFVKLIFENDFDPIVSRPRAPPLLTGQLFGTFE